MAKIDRIIQRRRADIIGRGIEALETAQQQAFQQGFMKGREYQTQLQREEIERAKKAAEAEIDAVAVRDGAVVSSSSEEPGDGDVPRGAEAGGGVPDERVCMPSSAEVSEGAEGGVPDAAR